MPPIPATDQLELSVDSGVAVVTLNRPQRLNAITDDMMRAFAGLWGGLDADPEVRVIVITGAGRGFCGGADVGALAEADEKPGEYQRLLSPRSCGVYKPVVAAVNGVCAGAGLHFVCDADLVLAADSATFLDPHVNVGQVSALEPISLSRVVPLGAVLRMVLLGSHERMTASRAQEVGLVSEVVPLERLMPRTRELASTIASASPAAVQGSLRAIWSGLDRGLSDALDEGWRILIDHRSHPDSREGPAAFLERRPPAWTVGPALSSDPSETPKEAE